jgi:hypothetical protein
VQSSDELWARRVAASCSSISTALLYHCDRRTQKYSIGSIKRRLYNTTRDEPKGSSCGGPENLDQGTFASGS